SAAPSGDKLADGMIHGGKLLFVFRHDVPLVQKRVMVKIKGAGGKGPDRGSLNLLQGEVEEGPVVGLEFHLPVGGEDLIVTSQIFQGGEAASGVAGLGPGIGEVQVDPVHFAGGEDLGDIRRIHADKT